jgi:hypothetical protein
MTTSSNRQFALEDLLARLGFKLAIVNERMRVYEHAATDSQVYLPAVPVSPRMWQGHFQVIRRTAIERGVLSEDCFEDIVDELRAALKQSQAATVR